MLNIFIWKTPNHPPPQDTMIVKLSGLGLLEVLAPLHFVHSLSKVVDSWKIFGFGAKQTYTQRKKKSRFL